MDEEKYAKELVRELESREINPKEWKKYKAGLKEGLKEEIPHLDVSKIVTVAETLKIKRDVKRLLDRIEEKIIATTRERKEALEKLRGEAPGKTQLPSRGFGRSPRERFESLKAEKIPSYLLGEVKENEEGIESILGEGKSKWRVRVGWDTVNLMTSRILETKDLITPYRLAKEGIAKRGKCKVIVRYLWERGYLEPTDWIKTKEYASIRFRPKRALGKAVFPIKEGAEDDSE